MDGDHNFCGPKHTSTCINRGEVGVLFHFQNIEILEFQQNTHLAAVCYNNGKSSLFRIRVGVTLSDLKHHLNQLNSCLHFRDDKRVANVEYRHLSVCSDGIVLHQHETSKRRRLENNVLYFLSVHRSVQTICSNLIRLRTFKEILDYMIEPGEDEIDAVNLFDS
jgi:hypothetical protein